jgi:hypothetical protein
MEGEAVKPNSLEADIYAERDIWFLRDSYNTYVNASQSTDQLLAALASNRTQFEPLRERYARAVHSDGGIQSPASRERLVLFKELNRLYSATEAIKDELRRRGAHYSIEVSDEEHPNAAYRRYVRLWTPQPRCFVVTSIYGPTSNELRQAASVCRRRFALNPLMMPSWFIYKLLGRFLGRLCQRNKVAAKCVETLFAQPIVRASDQQLAKAIPWMIYLSLWGWSIIGGIVLLLD